MTISVIRYCKYDNIPNEEYIHCGADGRISSLCNKESTTIYTQYAIKILPLEISFAPETSHLFKIHKLSYEIGFTYAGHVSVSLYTYSLLSYFCKRISPIIDSKESVNSLPSLESIAHLTGLILCNYFKDYGFSIGEKAIAEIVIFGFCSQTKGLKAYYIKPELNTSSKEFYPKIQDIDIRNRNYFAIGSGAHLLDEKVKLNNNIFNPKMIRKIINEQDISSNVGGAYQRAVAYKNVFIYLMIPI